jgi:cell division protein FtsQ
VDRSLALRLSRPAAIPVPRMPRRPLLALCIALLTLALLGGGWLWLRNSALVAVERVEVTGAVGTEGYAVRAALEEAALHMSTLDVNVGALRAAVAPLHVVSGLKVSTGFPHTLRIEVIERAPVAVLTVGGMKTAAAADGTLLGPALLRHGLPVVQGNGSEALGSGQVSNPNTREALAVLGAAPPALVGWVARVYNGAEGLTVAMRNGLLIYFGDATRAHAKWLSAARVLADTSSQGASYVDVRLPGRPAAGFPGGVANGSEAAATTAGRVSATDPTAASLAASLEQAIGSSTGTGSATSAASTTEAAAPATTSPTEAATPTPTSTSGAASAPRSPAEATAPATRSPGEAATSVPQSEPSSSTGG